LKSPTTDTGSPESGSANVTFTFPDASKRRFNMAGSFAP
jgi:hypothetical protein